MGASQRVLRHSIVALAMIAAAAGAARADSFAVTAGFFSAAYQKNISFQFVGSGLFLAGSTDSGNFDAWLCRPCAAGDTVGTSGSSSGTTLGGGTATINGTQYTGLSYSSVLQFSSVPVTMPTDPEVVYMSAAMPFTFTGWLSGYQAGIQDPLFTVNLTGQGLGYTDFARVATNDQVLWEFRMLRYDFQPFVQPEVVPEPASVLLVLSGLTLLVQARRRTRDAQRS